MGFSVSQGVNSVTCQRLNKRSIKRSHEYRHSNAYMYFKSSYKRSEMNWLCNVYPNSLEHCFCSCSLCPTGYLRTYCTVFYLLTCERDLKRSWVTTMYMTFVCTSPSYTSFVSLILRPASGIERFKSTKQCKSCTTTSNYCTVCMS